MQPFAVCKQQKMRKNAVRKQQITKSPLLKFINKILIGSLTHGKEMFGPCLILFKRF